MKENKEIFDKEKDLIKARVGHGKDKQKVEDFRQAPAGHGKMNRELEVQGKLQQVIAKIK